MNRRKLWHHFYSPTRTAQVLRGRLVAVVALTMFVTFAGMAHGQVQRAVIHSYRPESLPGYWTHDIFIDFAGQYTGSQMIVELTSGSIYNNDFFGFFGTDTPPNAALIGIFPDLQWDTFVANGGPTAQGSVGNFGLGGAAINIDPDFLGQGSERPAVFSDERIDQAWNPAGGNVIIDHEGFMVARLTVSYDSLGTFRFLASANQVFGPQEVTVVVDEVRRTVSGGERGVRLLMINGCFICIPEPSTLALLGVGFLALGGRRCWRTRPRRNVRKRQTTIPAGIAR